MADEWDTLAGVWAAAAERDPVFATDVLPLVASLIGSTGRWLDVGCGEGRVRRQLEVASIGCDISMELLQTARRSGAVVRCRLPSLGWLREGAVDGAYAVLVLEHLPDADRFFAETARVVRPGGSLVVVANHPAFTAAGSGPIVDLNDGEVLWRWGPYFEPAEVTIPLGTGEVTMHHRPLGALLTAAAGAGWSLSIMCEQPLSSAAVQAVPGYAGQGSMPRLVGLRWSR